MNKHSIDDILNDAWRHGPANHLLCIAVHAGIASDADAAIAAGANVNVNFFGQTTPLHLAVRSGNYNTVALLLHHGANPNNHDDQGITPNRLAQLCDVPAIAKLLEETAKQQDHTGRLAKRRSDDTERRVGQ